MLPKNSRRPLTLDHKIRLKKQLAKAYKSVGISADNKSGGDASFEQPRKRVHQDFKPRPQDKIIRKRQLEQEERDRLQEVLKINMTVIIDINHSYYRKRIERSRTVSRYAPRASRNAKNRIKS